MAIATKPAPSNHGAKAAAAVAANPFTKAAPRKVEPFMDVTRDLKSSAVRLDQQEIPATGFLRHLVLFVEVSGIDAAATFRPDAPWSLFDQVTFNDVNGQPLHNLSGYDLMVANDVGAYTQNADPTAAYGYDVAPADGKITFALRVPVEIIARGALGALDNTNGSMLYRLQIALAPIDSIFTANGGGSVRIRGVVESWGNPAPTDVHGSPNVTEPPALGTTQNWSEQTFALVNGQNTLKLARVGNSIRNLVLILRDAAGERTDAWPDELGIYFDGNQRMKAPTSYFLLRQQELYGRAFPKGVIVLPFTDDFDGTPGEEMGDFWLQTSGSTRFEVQAVFGATPKSLMVLTNDVLAAAAPAGGVGQTAGV